MVLAVVEASLACRTGKRPLPLPTVTCFGLPYCEAELLFVLPGESDRSPGIKTCSPLPFPPGELAAKSWYSEEFTGVSDPLDPSGEPDPVDLILTILGAARATVSAGIGTSLASSLYNPLAILERAREGVMDCRPVYCVSLLPDCIEDVLDLSLIHI